MLHFVTLSHGRHCALSCPFLKVTLEKNNSRIHFPNLIPCIAKALCENQQKLSPLEASECFSKHYYFIANYKTKPFLHYRTVDIK